jgi:hypothetical protein
MQFTPRTGWSPTQVEARPQPRRCALARLIVPPSLAYNLFQLGREQGADRGAFFCGKDSGLPQQVFLDLQSDVGLQGSTYCCVTQVYVLRSENSSRMMLWLDRQTTVQFQLSQRVKPALS